MSRNDEGIGYVPRMPVLSAPAAGSGAELELARLMRARRIGNPVASIRHRVGAWSSKRALEATASQLAALRDAQDKATEAIQAKEKLRRAHLEARVQTELAALTHEFALQAAVTQMHVEFNADKQRLHSVQRAALLAQHGVEAAVRFKEVKMQIGERRREAEMAELDPSEPARSTSGDPTTTIEALFRIRQQLRADGKDTQDVDDAINELAAHFGMAAE